MIVPDIGPEALALQDSDSFPAQRWPASAALIRRECPDWITTLHLILLSEFPVGIRETMEFIRDLLSELVDAMPPPEPDSAGQGDAHHYSDLPGSWRVL